MLQKVSVREGERDDAVFQLFSVGVCVGDVDGFNVIVGIVVKVMQGVLLTVSQCVVIVPDGLLVILERQCFVGVTDGDEEGEERTVIEFRS